MLWLRRRLAKALNIAVLRALGLRTFLEVIDRRFNILLDR